MKEINLKKKKKATNISTIDNILRLTNRRFLLKRYDNFQKQSPLFIIDYMKTNPKLDISRFEYYCIQRRRSETDLVIERVD